jgi:hypothetical protein
MDWKVTKRSDAGHPIEWRSKPWIIRLLYVDGSSLFQLWNEGKAMPECWTEDLEDALRMAETLGEQCKTS